MNEAETRAELINPRLKESGWGIVEYSKVLKEHHITPGKLQTGAGRAKPLISDYILVYKGRKLAVIEAKSDTLEVGEGVAQEKLLLLFKLPGNFSIHVGIQSGMVQEDREFYFSQIEIFWQIKLSMNSPHFLKMRWLELDLMKLGKKAQFQQMAVYFSQYFKHL